MLICMAQNRHYLVFHGSNENHTQEFMKMGSKSLSSSFSSLQRILRLGYFFLVFISSQLQKDIMLTSLKMQPSQTGDILSSRKKFKQLYISVTNNLYANHICTFLFWFLFFLIICLLQIFFYVTHTEWFSFIYWFYLVSHDLPFSPNLLSTITLGLIWVRISNITCYVQVALPGVCLNVI